MKLMQGKVVGGAIVVEGGELEEGTLVTVLIQDDASLVLSAEDEHEFLAAQQEIAQGDYLTTTELFDLLRRQRG